MSTYCLYDCVLYINCVDRSVKYLPWWLSLLHCFVVNVVLCGAILLQTMLFPVKEPETFRFIVSLKELGRYQPPKRFCLLSCGDLRDITCCVLPRQLLFHPKSPQCHVLTIHLCHDNFLPLYRSGLYLRLQAQELLLSLPPSPLSYPRSPGCQQLY